MADQSPIGSPLSNLDSDAFDDDDQERVPMPPSRKRQKVSDSKEAKESATPPRFAFEDDALEGMAISSDSSGEVPNSPGGAYRFDEDDIHEQVTACIWEGCNIGDLGNMDNLVKHIHLEHIESNQKAKKYPCEWMDCTRKGIAHASAYALRAHMRSHTREKPFYCELPECDRAFTRSDALAKHYRTVHETEALRPSDPIPKSMQANRTPRVKPKEFVAQAHPDIFVEFGSKKDERWASSYPIELGFTEEDEARGAKELYRLLRRQILWAEEDSEHLKGQCEALEEMRKREWLEKELLLDQAAQGERDYHERRRLVKEGLVPSLSNQEIKVAADRIWSNTYSPPNVHASSPTPMPNPSQPVEEARETAAILASMHHQA